MKNKLFLGFVFGLLFLSSPHSVEASIFEDLVGAVKTLQKQVVDLVSIKIDMPAATSTDAVEEDWKLFSDPVTGFEVSYPTDWSTSTIFRVTPRYKQASAFVRDSRLAFLSKVVKPDSTAVDLAVQDSAIFFSATSTEEAALYLNEKVAKVKVSTSTKEIGSSTVVYVLHSAKTDPAKFGGGSTEEYLFQNGSSTIIVEANYSDENPSGPVKNVLDKMLRTFRFISTEEGMAVASTTPSSASSTMESIGSGTSTLSTTTAEKKLPTDRASVIETAL